LIKIQSKLFFLKNHFLEVKLAQCESFRIFLWLRFRVGSILENVELLNLAYISVFKKCKIIEFKSQSLLICENGRFWNSAFTNFDFTYRKICVTEKFCNFHTVKVRWQSKKMDFTCSVAQKFKNFSATQILREIDLVHLEQLEIPDLYNFSNLMKLQMYQNWIQISLETGFCPILGTGHFYSEITHFM